MQFQEFYALYPRKVGKGAARRAFASACKRASADHIIAVLRVYPFDRSRPQFIPHPATWLNQDRYLDELKDVNPVPTSVWDDVYAQLPSTPEFDGATIEGDLFA